VLSPKSIATTHWVLTRPGTAPSTSLTLCPILALRDRYYFIDEETQGLRVDLSKGHTDPRAGLHDGKIHVLNNCPPQGCSEPTNKSLVFSLHLPCQQPAHFPRMVSSHPYFPCMLWGRTCRGITFSKMPYIQFLPAPLSS
jgi:hypothetical protein